jgi:aryl-alcohol dehydrogenase-like predicted oxidoreductase
MAQAYGFGIIPWSPLAGGLLTGKYRRNAPPPEDSRYANLDANPLYRRRMNDAIWDVIEPLESLAREKGTTISRFALAWCIHQPGVTSPIIGPRTMEQLEDNLGALEVTITDEDRKAIDRIIPPGTHVAPYYEADWRAGAYRW